MDLEQLFKRGRDINTAGRFQLEDTENLRKFKEMDKFHANEHSAARDAITNFHNGQISRTEDDLRMIEQSSNIVLTLLIPLIDYI